MSVAPLRSCSVMKPLKRLTQSAKRPFGVVRWPSMTRGMSGLVSLARAPGGEWAQPPAEWDLLHHFQVVALQAHDLLWIVGEQLQAPQPEILEDLRADPELPEPGPVAITAAVVLPGVGAGQRRDRADVLVEIDQHPAAGIGDGPEGLLQLLPALATGAAEEI